jgi:hypothetical protein
MWISPDWRGWGAINKDGTSGVPRIHRECYPICDLGQRRFSRLLAYYNDAGSVDCDVHYWPARLESDFGWHKERQTNRCDSRTHPAQCAETLAFRAGRLQQARRTRWRRLLLKWPFGPAVTMRMTMPRYLSADHTCISLTNRILPLRISQYVDEDFLRNLGTYKK